MRISTLIGPIYLKPQECLADKHSFRHNSAGNHLCISVFRQSPPVSHITFTYSFTPIWVKCFPHCRSFFTMWLCQKTMMKVQHCPTHSLYFVLCLCHTTVNFNSKHTKGLLKHLLQPADSYVLQHIRNSVLRPDSHKCSQSQNLRKNWISKQPAIIATKTIKMCCCKFEYHAAETLSFFFRYCGL